MTLYPALMRVSVQLSGWESVTHLRKCAAYTRRVPPTSLRAPAFRNWKCGVWFKLKEAPEGEDKKEKSTTVPKGAPNKVTAQPSVTAPTGERRCTNEAVRPNACSERVRSKRTSIVKMAVPGRRGRILYRQDSTEHV